MARPLDPITRTWNGPRPPVSVVILTFNEKHNIAACLDSCAWSDDVHVLDSGSTDGTQDASVAGGARVWTNPFTSFGQQRNWAIDHIPCKHEWVFHLDADERFTPELVREMNDLFRDPVGPKDAGYFVANQMILLGTWIRHASGYPNYQMRLFHKGRMRFTDVGHGQREETTGTIGTLRQPYVHHNFSKGLADWFARHNSYSTKESAEAIKTLDAPLALGDVFKDGLSRRRALKRLAFRLPARPTLRRLHTLFIQGGILDGRAGWNYAKMLGLYEGMIDLKIREKR